MPTYEYRCKDCGENLEVVQAFTDEALTECPYCQGALKKVFNSVGISFKGSGFYKNDSRSSSSSSSTSSTSSTSGGDSTPAPSTKEPASSTAASSDSGPSSGSGA